MTYHKKAKRFQVQGAPCAELSRSPAASMIGLLAERSELLLAHYEYRVQLDPPAHWLPDNRPDLGERGEWVGGVLPESKYQTFCNDLILGSFHPGHRAKWTAHELCHGLVGFAWRPGASHFFHALSARLSELLPVALYYFFDEAYLKRCPLHEHGGPLFGAYCPACERAAAEGPDRDSAPAERFMAEGRAFVERELAAVARSKRLGRPVPSPWANLDLMSDGLAYAAAHGLRLNAPQLERYMYLFFPEGCGLHHDLEALEARVLEVMNGICYGTPVVPLRGNRALWIAQDVGRRLLEVSSETEGMASRNLVKLAERLAADPSEQGLAEVVTAYEALNENYHLPEPADFFALGYPMPGGYGRSVRQIAEGIASACPETVALLEEHGYAPLEVAARFAAQDAHERLPLGLRFCRWLGTDMPAVARDLARFEATVAHAPPADPVTLSLQPFPQSDLWRTAEDVSVLPTTHEAMTRMGIEVGDEGAQPFLAVRRDATGEVHLIHLPTHLGKALESMQQAPAEPGPLGLTESDIDMLAEWQLVVPDAFSLSRPDLLGRR